MKVEEFKLRVNNAVKFFKDFNNNDIFSYTEEIENISGFDDVKYPHVVFTTFINQGALDEKVIARFRRSIGNESIEKTKEDLYDMIINHWIVFGFIKVLE